MGGLLRGRRQEEVPLCGKTKKVVTDRLRERLFCGLTDFVREANGMGVGEYLDRWLPTGLPTVRGTVKERTLVRHEEVVRLHLKPTLGNVKLPKLNALGVQELYRAKLEAGLSPRTVQIVHTTLSKALKQAVRWPLVPGSVTTEVSPPRSRKKEIRILAPEETKRLLYAARGRGLRPSTSWPSPPGCARVSFSV